MLLKGGIPYIEVGRPSSIGNSGAQPPPTCPLLGGLFYMHITTITLTLNLPFIFFFLFFF
jgi:hypothetical protein